MAEAIDQAPILGRVKTSSTRSRARVSRDSSAEHTWRRRGRRVVMKQKIVALTSILGGLGVMALVVSLQRDPLSWTSAGQPDPTDVSPTILPQSKEEAPQSPLAASSASPVLELPEVRIESRLSVPQRAEQRKERESLEPCSEWRDIGPAYVDRGEPFGTRRIRNLC